MALFKWNDPKEPGYSRAAVRNGLSEFEPWDDHDWAWEGANIICETASKFEPIIDDRFELFQTTENASYLISRFRLLWDDAQSTCKQKGGWLAELRTPSANR